MSALALPAPPAAHEPPEANGLARDAVALLVAERASGKLTDTGFRAIGEHLCEGDLLVINTSATLPAAVKATIEGEAVLVHFSTPAGEDPATAFDQPGPPRWAIEVRAADGSRYPLPPLGTVLTLPGGASATLGSAVSGSERLAVARLRLSRPVERYLAAHGQPIRYPHVSRPWPIRAYQTIWAREAGSAEMPSAGRPFTATLVAELVARGVRFAPIVLHAGVSSLEAGEDPLPERFAVSAATARLVGATRAWGGRVIAVGTTVVRALESIAAPDGTLAPAAGTTDVVITAERGVHAVDGLLTGWHEPEASHLRMLEAIAGPELLERSYRAAVEHGYRGHEFGDMHLILP
jgi:S-adenosylmethionine:tRNA ribosyltransferase-isomerase